MDDVIIVVDCANLLMPLDGSLDVKVDVNDDDVVVFADDYVHYFQMDNLFVELYKHSMLVAVDPVDYYVDVELSQNYLVQLELYALSILLT